MKSLFTRTSVGATKSPSLVGGLHRPPLGAAATTALGSPSSSSSLSLTPQLLRHCSSTTGGSTTTSLGFTSPSSSSPSSTGGSSASQQPADIDGGVASSSSSSSNSPPDAPRTLDETHELTEQDRQLIKDSVRDAARVREARAAEDRALQQEADTRGISLEQLKKEQAEQHQLLSAAKGKQMGGAGMGNVKGDMMAIFTCSVCETRSAKQFTKHAYQHGIVVVQCPGCANRHLLADNLGWFEGESRNIEDILREKGEEVTRIKGGVFVETIKGFAPANPPPSDDK